MLFSEDKNKYGCMTTVKCKVNRDILKKKYMKSLFISLDARNKKKSN